MEALREPIPTQILLPPEHKYEAPIEDATEQTERKGQISSIQLKIEQKL